MGAPNKVCWNCNNCDTFAGICFKGKFVNFPNPVILSAHTCEEFDNNFITKITIENKRLKEENEKLIEANFQYNLQYSKDADMIHRLSNTLKRCNPYLPIEHGFSDCDRCASCNNYYDLGHKESCEYIKLTGGKNND
jgi:hypothetical protein